MKRLTILGLAVVAALALTAIVGMGSAFAAKTTLCETSTGSPNCAVGDWYPKSTSLKASSSNFAITVHKSEKSENYDVTCTGSALQGGTTAASGEPLPVEIASWTTTGCTMPVLQGSSCSVTAVNLPYAGGLAWQSSDDGTLSVENGGKGSPGLYASCKWLGLTVLNCTYSLKSSLEFNGGATAQIAANDVQLNGAGGTCPGVSQTLSADYALETPKPAHVAKALPPPPPPSPPSPPALMETLLCAAPVAPCEESNWYGKGTKIKAQGVDVKLVSAGVSSVCKESVVEGETTSAIGEPLDLTISSWKMTCNNLPSGHWCVGIAQGLPYEGFLTYYDGSYGDGFLAVDRPEWLFEVGLCGGNQSLGSCTFRAAESEMPIELVGGEPGWILVNAPLEMVGKSYCPGFGATSLVGVYEITSPDPVYVSEPAF